MTSRPSIDQAGFAPAARRERRQSTALTQLIAIAALIVSIAILATTISYGIARADGIQAAAPLSR